MNLYFVFLLMIYFHILDDFVLQGILAKLKCKSWWEDNYPQPLYRHDYKIALLIHAMSWSFSMMLPIAIYAKFNIDLYFVIMYIINVLIHGQIDYLKANQKKINLIEDQFAHFVQIIVTFGMLVPFI